jgi:hypothetical protein
LSAPCCSAKKPPGADAFRSQALHLSAAPPQPTYYPPSFKGGSDDKIARRTFAFSMDSLLTPARAKKDLWRPCQSYPSPSSIMTRLVKKFRATCDSWRYQPKTQELTAPLIKNAAIFVEV